jgi:hypothetical protein
VELIKVIIVHPVKRAFDASPQVKPAMPILFFHYHLPQLVAAQVS